MKALHKCYVPVIAEKVSGLKEVRPCGKLALIKERGGKGFICSDHAAAAQRRRDNAVQVRAQQS